MSAQPDGAAAGRDGRIGARGTAARAFLVLLSAAATYGVLYLTALPVQYSIREGDIGTDIKAPRDIVDTYTTQQNVKAARDNVEDKYRQDDTVSASVLAKIGDCFAAMDDVRVFGKETADAVRLERAEAIAEYNARQEEAGNATTTPAPGASPAPPATPEPTPVPADAPVEFGPEFIEACGNMLPISFSSEDIVHLVTMEQEEYDRLNQEVAGLVASAMRSGIKEEFLQNSITQINAELMNAAYGFSQSTQRLGMNIVAAYLRANFIYDEAATQAARDLAEKAVPAAIYKKGQNIVRDGEPVTHAQYLVLEELGLIRRETVDVTILAGLAVFLTLVLAAAALGLSLFERETFLDLRKFAALCLLYLLALALSWGAVQIHPYLQPTGMGILLIAVLINRRAALVMSIPLAVLAGFMSGGGRSGITVEALPVAASVLVSGILGIRMVSRSPQRMTLLYAGAAMGLTGALTIGAFDIMSRAGWEQVLLGTGMSLASGIIASFFCIGTLPLWESVFGLVTPMKLLELSNPNQPLLKRLLLEAPGSYHHSIIVGNLAERAAEAIGADVLLSRAGAYYHDIGKLTRPYFFGENQVGTENPHDSISPELSTRIITTHAREGMALARQHRLPAPIRDAIAQHHGTTPVSFFYHKKMGEAPDKEGVDIEDYRYEGPKPRTRETAILMLADSVEAAVRSLNKPSPERVEELIRDIIRAKLNDAQLSESPLTLRDLETIVGAFQNSLNGVFHERIEYPPLK